jgi:hypothetical protein
VSRRRWFLLLVVLAAFLATLANFYLSPRLPSGPTILFVPVEPTAATTMPLATPTGPEPTPPPGLPALDASDAWVRGLAEQLCAHPKVSSWLATGGLVRRFVVVVDNVAEGTSPKKHLGPLAPKGRFEVIERRGRFFVDPRSYDRYDAVADTIAALDTSGCAELYRRVRPLAVEAYRDLGYPNRRFDDTLDRAIAALLDVPAEEADVELEPRVRSYEYADPRLRSLTAAQKQFLRMGPRNDRKVKAKLLELAKELRLPVGAREGL